jgi:hypothetical protein
VTVVNEPVHQGPATWFDTRVVRENIKEPHLQERRFFLEATDFGTFGATRPRLTGRELLLPMFAGEIDPNASVLETTSDREKFAQMGRAACLAPVSGAGWADDHAFCLRESTALLYYPMWVLGFEQGNRVSHIVVDGRDGSINAGIAPAANGRRVALLAAQVAFLAILAVIFIWFAATWQQGRDSLVALAVIVSVAAIVIVWRFRPVREVEYHEPFSS